VSKSVVVTDSFEQALAIVYRMLFLLFAEARALVLCGIRLPGSYNLEDCAMRQTVPPRPDSGMPCARLPGWRTQAAGRATCT
jgi:hypothetical protein